MMLRDALSILALAVTAMPSAWGCSHHESVAPAPRAEVDVPVYSDACPLAHIRGVEAHATDVPGGIAVELTAPDRAGDLVRANVHAMAIASDQQGDPFVVCPCGASSVTGVPLTDIGRTSMQPLSSIPVRLATAGVTETPGGATLVLVAADVADADVLRNAVREDLTRMTPCVAYP